MSGFFQDVAAHLRNGVLLLCLTLSLVVAACSNQGVALNGDVVVQKSASMELGDIDRSPVESASLDDAINGSGL